MWYSEKLLIEGIKMTRNLMRKKKNNRFPPILVIFLLLICGAVYVTKDYMNRPIWFDEAVTINDFLLQSDVGNIYLNYSIPNNHIVYNYFLRGFLFCFGKFLPLSEFAFRFFSLIIGAASAAAMFLLWRKRFGTAVSFLAALCLIFSIPFAIYATAIRGYMLGFLSVLAGLESALRWEEQRKIKYLAVYFFSALISVGIMPSNIFAFGIVFILAEKQFFFCRKKGTEIIKSLMLGILPVFAFLIFYLPILKKLVRALSVKEGWSDWAAAVFHLYGAFSVSFLPLIIVGLCGILLLGKDKFRKNIVILIKGLIAAAGPLLIMIIITPAPFPRVFFPYWVLWIYLLCFPLKKNMAFSYKKSGKPGMMFFVIAAGLVIISLGLIFKGSTPSLSKFFTSSGQDDFFRPYFLEDSFNPAGTVKKLHELTENGKTKVFIYRGMDYPSLVLYWKLLNFPSTTLLFDRPSKLLNSLGNLDSLYMVSTSDGDIESLKKRFPIIDYRPVNDLGYYKIFFVKIKTSDREM